MTLDEITEQFRGRVDKNGGIAGKVVKFNFKEDGVIRIDGRATPATVDNADDPADCTVAISKSDFIDMAGGKLNATSAFMGGKLKVDGDMGIAMKLGSILA